MIFKCVFVTAAVGLSVSQAAIAATQQDANALKASIEKYLSTTPGVVTVSPGNEDIDLTIDLSPLINNINSAPFKASVSAVHLKLKSVGGGKWSYEQKEPWSLTVKNGDDIAFEYKIGNITQSGIWDEALGASSDLKFVVKDYSILQNIVDPRMSARNSTKARLPEMTGEFHGTPSAQGGIDIATNYRMRNYFAETEITPQDKGSQPFRFSYNVPSVESNTTAKGLRQKELLELLAWFVAHPSAETIRSNQQDLKTLLVSALPVFENISGTFAASTISIKTMLGDAKIGHISGLLDVNGAIKDGKFREAVEFSGLKFPTAKLPPWSVKLVPDRSKFDFSVNGFDAAAVTKLALDNLDLAKDPPIPAELKQKLLDAFSPSGTIAFLLGPSAVSSELYELKMEGDLKLNLAGKLPSGKATIRLKGFDKTLKALQDAAASEPSVQQAIGVFLAAKGFSKSEGDELVWAIESGNQGQVLVNGVDLGKM